jgi:hypothetical protein
VGAREVDSHLYRCGGGAAAALCPLRLSDGLQETLQTKRKNKAHPLATLPEGLKSLTIGASGRGEEQRSSDVRSRIDDVISQNYDVRSMTDNWSGQRMNKPNKFHACYQANG